MNLRSFKRVHSPHVLMQAVKYITRKFFVAFYEGKVCGELEFYICGLFFSKQHPCVFTSTLPFEVSFNRFNI